MRAVQPAGSLACAAAQRGQMQATFLASGGMAESEVSGMFTLKHQHSVLPWLMPQLFGCPHTGHRLGSTAFVIETAPTLALNSGCFERVTEDRSQ